MELKEFYLNFILVPSSMGESVDQAQDSPPGLQCPLNSSVKGGGLWASSVESTETAVCCPALSLQNEGQLEALGNCEEGQQLH